jgi:2-haloacid dehalogenase
VAAADAELAQPPPDTGLVTLRMLAATRGITISDADSAELTDRFATMPPHPEVPAALRRLRDHGFRLFTLTDNTLEISGRQLERAGVIDVFERRFSVVSASTKPCGAISRRRRPITR